MIYSKPNCLIRRPWEHRRCPSQPLGSWRILKCSNIQGWPTSKDKLKGKGGESFRFEGRGGHGVFWGPKGVQCGWRIDQVWVWGAGLAEVGSYPKSSEWRNSDGKWHDWVSILQRSFNWEWAEQSGGPDCHLGGQWWWPGLDRGRPCMLLEARGAPHSYSGPFGGAFGRQWGVQSRLRLLPPLKRLKGSQGSSPTGEGWRDLTGCKRPRSSLGLVRPPMSKESHMGNCSDQQERRCCTWPSHS